MRSIVSRSSTGLAALLLSVVLAFACATATARTLIDPVFGLSIHTNDDAFPPAPAALFRSCPDLTNPRWDRQAWVFAQVRGQDRDWTLIAGFFVDRRRPASVETDSKGAIVLIDGNTCRLFGPAREVLDYGDDGITEAERRNLAKDAIARLARGLNGIAGLRSRLEQARALPDPARSKILADMLAAAAP